MSYGRLRSLLYTFSFCDEFVLIYPLYAVMFVDKGLNAAQISTLFIVWSVTAFLLEIPSGSVADKYPRKYVLMGATLLKALAFGCWLLFPNYVGFLVGFMLWGANTAFTSGTLEALVYDELQRLNKTKSYAKIVGLMESLDLIGAALAALVASLLAGKGYGFILLLSITTSLISVVIVMFLPYVKKTASTSDDKYFTYLTEGVKLVWQNSKILFIVSFAAIVTGWGAVDEYWGLLFREQAVSNSLIAFWTGVIFLVGAIGTGIAYRFENRIRTQTFILIGAASSLWLATILQGSFSPLALCLFVLLFAISKVLFNATLQHAINDKTRATSTSVAGFVAELFALMIFGMFALTASTNSYSFSLQLVAGFIFAGAILYAVIGRYGLRKRIN